MRNYCRNIAQVLVLIFIIIYTTGCATIHDFANQDYFKEGNQEVAIVINYEKNMLLAKEQLDIYVDNHKFYSVKNGDSNDNVYKLSTGTHVLKIVSNNKHFAAEEFIVENTGDSFVFNVKNHMDSITLGLDTKFNIYTIQGDSVPETPKDDETNQLSISQIEKAKEVRTVWSLIWLLIKGCIILFVIMLVFFALGFICYSILKPLKLVTLAMLGECVAIGFIVFSNGYSLASLIIMICFVIMCFSALGKVNTIPNEYRNFVFINENITQVCSLIIGCLTPILLLYKPELQKQLPFTLDDFDIYLYANLVCTLLYGMIVLLKALDLPNELKAWFSDKDIIDKKDIDSFIDYYMSHHELAADNDLDENVYKILYDFVHIGDLERDELLNGFRVIKRNV